METRACLTGFGVLAAAAAIGAEPNPDSLEKTPLDTPILIVCITVAPRKPPTAAVGVNACLKMRAKIWGIIDIFMSRIIEAPVI